MSKNRLDYTANLGRHSHDVSAGYTSSLTTGPIVPQYFDILGPGDKIFYKTHMFCRFQHMPTAFLGEVDLHLDYFFVPLQMLYTAFGQVFAQTNDVLSDFFEGSDFGTNPDTLPIMDLNSFFNVQSNYELFVTEPSPYCEESLMKGTFRLLDALNICPLVVGTHGYKESQYGFKFNNYVFIGFPSALLAYQAIYQKFFRNEEIEKFDISSFNVDTTSMMANKMIPTSQYRRFLTLRYSGRPNDYFTDVRFSPIATSINTLAVDSNDDSGVNGGRAQSFGSLFSRVSNFLHSQGEDYNSQGVGELLGSAPTYSNKLQGVTSYTQLQQPEDNSYLSAQNIRAVFALDKYMRVYGRAGKTYDDQILAHFGVKIPHDVKHDITHLKHYRMVLQSDPVVSTADTAEGNVGSVGGQLAAQLDTDEVSFTAPVHGVFMCVARLIPHPRYFMTNDRLHAISERLSFPIPEFDKLGAQPVYSVEYGFNTEEIQTKTDYIWKNRYSEFKEKYNRASITYAHHLTPNQGVNFFSPWVVSKKPYGFNTENYDAFPVFSSFFVQPNDLDNVMVTKYVLDFPSFETWAPNPHIVLQTDPVLTEYACFAKKVSWMSPTGEPEL